VAEEAEMLLAERLVGASQFWATHPVELKMVEGE
jgi:hypothetical protein